MSISIFTVISQKKKHYPNEHIFTSY